MNDVSLIAIIGDEREADRDFQGKFEWIRDQCLGFEPGATGWKMQIDPLDNSVPTFADILA